MLLFPIPYEKESEDKSSKMCKMCYTTTRSGHSSEKFNSSEYQYKPLGFQRYRRKYQGKNRIRIQHCISHQHTIYGT